MTPRQGHYCHLIIDEKTVTQGYLGFRSQGLSSDLCCLSAALMPVLGLAKQHDLADCCNCSFPSKRPISVTGQVPFPLSLLSGMMATDEALSGSGEHIMLNLLNEYTLTRKKVLLLQRQC